MDAELKARFLEHWDRYFPGAELPIGFYYSNSAETKPVAKSIEGHRCVMGDLAKVRKGKTVCFSADYDRLPWRETVLWFREQAVSPV